MRIAKYVVAMLVLASVFSVTQSLNISVESQEAKQPKIKVVPLLQKEIKPSITNIKETIENQQIPRKLYTRLSGSITVIDPPSGSDVLGTINITVSWSVSTLLTETALPKILVYLKDSDGNTYGVGTDYGDPVAGRQTVSDSSSFIVDTTQYANGLYTILAYLYDDNSGTLLASDTDNTINIVNPEYPPSISISAPTNDSVFPYPASFKLNFTVSDQNGNLKSYTVTLDGQVVDTGTISGYSVSLSVPITIDSTGTHNIEVTATDQAGLESTANVRVIVDSLSPTIDSVTYVDKTENPKVEITVAASDNIGLSKIEIYEGTELLNSSIMNGTSDTKALIVDLKSQGYHNLVIKVYDEAGYVAEKTITILVDNEYPTISTDAPETLYVNDVTVTIQFTFSDSVELGYYDVILNNVHYSTGELTGTTQTVSITVQIDPEIEYNLLLVKVNDTYGHENSTSIVIYYDVEAPTISFSISNYTYLNTPTYLIHVTVSDDRQLYNYSYKWGTTEGSGTLTGTSGGFDVSISATTGEYTLEVTVWDAAGNKAKAILIFYIDLEAPTITVNTPNNDSYFSSTSINISFSSSDNFELGGYNITTSGGLEYKDSWSGTTNSYSGEIIVGSSDGEYIITIEVWDAAGNKAEVNIRIIVDTTPPTINSISIGDYSIPVSTSTPYYVVVLENNGIVLSVSASDTNFYKITIEINGPTYSSEEYTVTSVNHSIVLTQSGEYTVNISVSDLAGNVVSWSYLKIIVVSGEYMITVTGLNQYYNSDTLSSATISISVDWSGEIIKPWNTTIKIGNKEIILYNVSPLLSETHYAIFTENDILSLKSGTGTSTYTVALSDFGLTSTGEYILNITSIYAGISDAIFNVEYQFVLDVNPPSITVTIENIAVYIINSTHFIAYKNFTYSIDVSDDYSYTSDYTLIITLTNSTDEESKTYAFGGLEYSGIIIIDDYLKIREDTVITVTFKVVDPAGNTATQEFKAIIDVEAPIINIDYPTNNTITSSQQITATWTIDNYKDLTLKNYTVSVYDASGELIAEIYCIPENFTYTLTIPYNGDGIYSMAIIAEDYLGRVSLTTVAFIFDRSGPEIILIDPTGPGEWFNDEMHLEVQAIDEYANVSSVTIMIDNTILAQTFTDKDTDPQVFHLDANISLASYSEGTHILNITFIDSLGNKNSITVEFGIDRTPPTIDIVAVTAQGNLTIDSLNVSIIPNVTFVWSVNDDYSGVDISFANISGFALYYNGKDFPIDIDGTYNIVFYARDNVGNVRKIFIMNLTVDTGAPNIYILNLINDAWYNTSYINVEWDVSEYNVKLTIYWWNETYSANATVDGDTSNSYMIRLSEGNWTIVLEAVDAAGNRNSTSIVIHIDLTPPVIEYYSSVTNETVASMVYVNWSMYDDVELARGEVSLNGEYLFGNYVNITEDGEYLLVLVAEDLAGNIERVVLNFSVDTLPPIVEIITPENGTWVNSDSVNITWIIDDAHLALVELKINGRRVYFESANNVSYKTSYITDYLDNGVDTVELYVYDAAGNMAIVRLYINVDKIKPEIHIVSPINGSTYGPNVTVIYEVYDENLKSFYFVIDGVTYNTTEAILTLDTGYYIITVFAEDMAGNYEVAMVSFYVDAEPPVIEEIFVNELPNTTILNNTVIQIGFNVTESGSIVVVVDGNIVYNGTVTGLVSIDLDSLGIALDEGQHEVVVRVTDGYGNSAEYEYSIIVDKTPPEISVLGITNQTVVGEALTISVKVSDNIAFEKVEIYVNGSLYATFSDDTTFDIVFNETGNYTITFAAYDVAGNKITKTYHLTVKETAEEESTSGGESSGDVNPYPEENTTIPENNETKEETPIYDESDIMTKITLAMITIALISFFALFILRKKKRAAAFFLAVALLFSIPFVGSWAITSNSSSSSDSSALAELKENGTLTVYDAQMNLIKVGSLPGMISTLKLGDYDDFPRDPEYLDPAYYGLKDAIRGLAFQAGTSYPKFTIVWSPGYGISNDTVSRYFLDLFYQYAETTSDSAIFLFGRYATTRNLLEAIKYANLYGRDVTVVILTHSTDDAIYTKDSGGYLLNASVLESLLDKYEPDTMNAKIIALYCNASTHPVTDVFREHGAVVYALNGSPEGLGLLNEMIKFLFGGVWYLEYKKYSGTVRIEGEDVILVHEVSDALNRISIPINGTNASFISITRNIKVYLVDPNTNSTYFRPYETEKIVVVNKPKTVESRTTTVYVDGYINWTHKYRQGIPQLSLGDFFTGYDWEAETIRIISWLRDNYDDIQQGISRLRTGVSLEEAEQIFAKLTAVKQRLDRLTDIRRTVYELRKKIDRDVYHGVLVLFRKYNKLLSSLRVTLARVMWTEKYFLQAKDILSFLGLIAERKDLILESLERIKSGNYTNMTQLVNDLAELGAGIRTSFKLMIMKFRLRLISKILPGLAGEIKRALDSVAPLMKLYQNYFDLIKGRILESNYHYIQALNSMLEYFNATWNNTMTITNRLASGDYEPNINVTSLVQNDMDYLARQLDLLQTLRALSYRMLVLKFFYPQYATLYNKARFYLSAYTSILKAIYKGRYTLLVARISETAVRYFGEYLNLIDEGNALVNKIKEMMNDTGIIINQDENASVPLNISYTNRTLELIENLTSMKKTLLDKIFLLIEKHNDLNAIRLKLKYLLNSNLKQRTLELIELQPETITKLAEYMNTIDNLVKLLKTIIRIADLHNKGLQTLVETKDILDQIASMDAATLDNAEELLSGLEDQAKEKIATLTNIGFTLSAINSELSRTLSLPLLGFNDIVVSLASEALNWNGELINWYQMKTGSMKFLLRVVLATWDFNNVVVPRFIVVWDNIITKSSLNETTELYEDTYELEDMYRMLLAKRIELSKLLYEASLHPDVKTDVENYLSWSETLYEMFKLVSGFYKYYDTTAKLLDYSNKLNEIIDNVLSKEEEIKTYINSTINNIEAGTYDYLLATTGDATLDNIARFLDNVRAYLANLVYEVINVGAFFFATKTIVASLFSIVAKAQITSYLAENSTVAEESLYIGRYYVSDTPTTYNMKYLLEGISNNISSIIDLNASGNEAVFTPIVERVERDLINIYYTKDIASSVIGSAIYGRLETLVYDRIKSSFESILDTLDTKAIELYSNQLTLLVSMHNNALNSLDDRGSEFLEEIISMATSINPEIEKASTTDFLGIANNIVGTYLRLERLQDETSIWYTLVNDGSSIKLAVINTADPETAKEIAESPDLSDPISIIEDPNEVVDILGSLQYTLNEYQATRIPSTTTGLTIDSILEGIYDKLEEIYNNLGYWAESTQKVLSYKKNLLASYNIDVDLDASEPVNDAGATLDAFVFVDELVDTITKKFGAFKNWLRSRLEDYLSWIKWPFTWVKDWIINYIMGLLVGPAELFVQILNTDIAKSILAAMYYLIRAGASAIKIIAMGIVWLILKGIEWLSWIIENVMNWVIDLFPFPESWKSVARQIISGTYGKIVDWAGEAAMYAKEVLDSAVAELAESVMAFAGMFAKGLQNLISVIMDAATPMAWLLYYEFLKKMAGSDTYGILRNSEINIIFVRAMQALAKSLMKSDIEYMLAKEGILVRLAYETHISPEDIDTIRIFDPTGSSSFDVAYAMFAYPVGSGVILWDKYNYGYYLMLPEIPDALSSEELSEIVDWASRYVWLNKENYTVFQYVGSLMKSSGSIPDLEYTSDAIDTMIGEIQNYAYNTTDLVLADRLDSFVDSIFTYKAMYSSSPSNIYLAAYMSGFVLGLMKYTTTNAPSEFTDSLYTWLTLGNSTNVEDIVRYYEALGLLAVPLPSEKLMEYGLVVNREIADDELGGMTVLEADSIGLGLWRKYYLDSDNHGVFIFEGEIHIPTIVSMEDPVKDEFSERGLAGVPVVLKGVYREFSRSKSIVGSAKIILKDAFIVDIEPLIIRIDSPSYIILDSENNVVDIQFNMDSAYLEPVYRSAMVSLVNTRYSVNTTIFESYTENLTMGKSLYFFEREAFKDAIKKPLELLIGMGILRVMRDGDLVFDYDVKEVVDDLAYLLAYRLVDITPGRFAWLILATYYLDNYFEYIIKDLFWFPALHVIEAVFGNIYDASPLAFIKNVIMYVIRKVVVAIDVLKDLIMKTGEAIKNFIVAAINRDLNELKELSTGLFDVLISIVESINSALADYIREYAEKIRNEIKEIIDTYKENLEELKDDIRETLTNIKATLEHILFVLYVLFMKFYFLDELLAHTNRIIRLVGEGFNDTLGTTISVLSASASPRKNLDDYLKNLDVLMLGDKTNFAFIHSRLANRLSLNRTMDENVLRLNEIWNITNDLLSLSSAIKNGDASKMRNIVGVINNYIEIFKKIKTLGGSAKYVSLNVATYLEGLRDSVVRIINNIDSLRNAPGVLKVAASTLSSTIWGWRQGLVLIYAKVLFSYEPYYTYEKDGYRIYYYDSTKSWKPYTSDPSLYTFLVWSMYSYMYDYAVSIARTLVITPLELTKKQFINDYVIGPIKKFGGVLMSKLKPYIGLLRTDPRAFFDKFKLAINETIAEAKDNILEWIPSPTAFLKNLANKIVSTLKKNLTNIFVSMGGSLVALALSALKAPTKGGLPMIYQSTVLEFFRFSAPAIIWDILSVAFTIAFGGMIIYDMVKNAADIIKNAKVKIFDEVQTIQKTLDLGASLIYGLYGYHKAWGIGLFGSMPITVLFASISWAYAKLAGINYKTTSTFKIEGVSILSERYKMLAGFLVSLLDTFASLADPLKIYTPTSKTFGVYVKIGTPSEPWNTIIKIIITALSLVFTTLTFAQNLGINAIKEALFTTFDIIIDAIKSDPFGAITKIYSIIRYIK